MVEETRGSGAVISLTHSLTHEREGGEGKERSARQAALGNDVKHL